MIAGYHRQAIQANAHLGAKLALITHANPARFAEIEAQFGVPCVTEAKMLANPDIDAVCISTPSGQHAAQTIAAAQHGKHVLVEKPMALNVKDAQRMIDVCHREEVQLGVVLQRRVKPVFRQVYDAIMAGDLGSITVGVVTMPYFRSQAYYDQAMWRGIWALDGGGVIMNQGIHMIDLLLWYMGNPIETRAFGGTLAYQIEVEDTLTATLHFDNGAVATINGTTTTSPGFPHRLEFYGTKGYIQIEGESIVRWQVETPSFEPFYQTGCEVNSGMDGIPSGIDANGHTAIVADFVSTVRENRPPVIDGTEGMRSLAAITTIYQSAGLNQ